MEKYNYLKAVKDVTIRCYLLAQAIAEVLDEVEEDNEE